MIEPKWLSRQMLLAMHAEAVWRFGGLSGTRDESLQESAIERPRNRFHYHPESTLFELAASLGFGLIKNHPFNDGNKRTGLLAMRAFLFLNHYQLEPAEADEVETVVGVAEGSVTETMLSGWLERNC